jgi:hypothetical protein
MPGFTSREPPLALRNIGCHRYRGPSKLIDEAVQLRRGKSPRNGIYLYGECFRLLPRDQLFIRIGHGTETSISIVPPLTEKLES